MKTIKIKIVDGYESMGPSFIKILSKFYNVELSDNPDYIIYSVFGAEHAHYECIKIFFTGENTRADFNCCDYAITFDFMDFLDRHLRIPLYYFHGTFQNAIDKHKNIDESILKDKDKFCNFIVTNGRDKSTKFRDEFFERLNEYKFVHSGGRHKNNIGYTIEDKLKFQSQCKFSLAFENSSSPGYLTEKLIDAAGAKTIPIYWGDDRVSIPLSENGSGINPKAFVNVHNFKNIDEAIEYIKMLDNDDEKYLSMLREPLFLQQNIKEIYSQKLETFLRNIFDQPYEMAFRRGNGAYIQASNDRYKLYSFEKQKEYISTVELIKTMIIWGGGGNTKFYRICKKIYRKIKSLNKP